MKRLHKLILKSFLGPFVLVFFIVMFVLLMQFLWRYIDDLVGKGLTIGVISELLLYTSASLVPMALPLSILMSSLMTFGNMGEYYELTAIKSSGISLQRVMKPLVIFVIFVSIGAFFFVNRVMPYTNLKMRSLLYDVRQQRPELQIKPGEFYNGVNDYSIRVEGKDPETNMLYDLHIYDHSERKGNISVTVADSGLMKMTSDERELIITLYHGTSYNEMQEERRGSRNRTYPEEMDKFGEQRFIIPLTGFGLQRTDENLFKSNYQMMNLSQLNKMQDSLQTDMNGNRKRFEKVLYINNLFKVRNYKPPIKHKLPPKANLNLQKFGKVIENKEDTFQNKAQTINLDTILNKMGESNEKRMITQALMNARSTKIFIEDSKNNYEFQKKHLRRYQIEWHRKFTISFACFIFLFIGAPLGAIIRKGGLGMPLVLSTLLFIFYYITSMMGEKFVRESILPDYEGMWLSSFILLIIGIFLTFKATTDSRIFNIESYKNILKRLISFFVNKSHKKENRINDMNPV